MTRFTAARIQCTQMSQNAQSPGPYAIRRSHQISTGRALRSQVEISQVELPVDHVGQRVVVVRAAPPEPQALVDAVRRLEAL